MKNILLLFTLLFIYLQLSAQKIVSVKTLVNEGCFYRMVPQEGKGIWLASNNGVSLFNPATGKFTTYNTTTDNKQLSFVRHISVFKDKVACAGKDGIFLLQANGKWKNITPASFKVGSPVHALSLSAEELTVIDSYALYRYRNNNWLPAIQQSSFFYSTKSNNNFVYADGRRYYFAGLDGIYFLDTLTKEIKLFKETAYYQILPQPGKGFWILNEYRLEFVPNGFTGDKSEINFYDGYLFGSYGISLKFYRLIPNEKHEPFIIEQYSDTVVKLSWSPQLKDHNKIHVEKKVVPKTIRRIFDFVEYALYNDIFYYIEYDGFGRMTSTKKENLHGVKLKSSKIQGYNLMTPDGRLITKDWNQIWISNGKDPAKKIIPDKIYSLVLDMTTDGKNLYVLTERNIYKESTPGKLDSLGVNDNNMSQIAVDKKGIIWMVGREGITTLQNGKKEFIPAKDIQGFPPNYNPGNIFIGPESTIYISLKNIYTYKDKKMTILADSPGMASEHYFDGKGNIYCIDIGKYFLYNGSKSTNLEKMVAEKYPEAKNPFISAIAVDNKGRGWALVTFYKEKKITGLVVVENGKIINLFTEGLNITEPGDCKLFFRKNELVITDSGAGWTESRPGWTVLKIAE